MALSLPMHSNAGSNGLFARHWLMSLFINRLPLFACEERTRPQTKRGNRLMKRLINQC